MSSDKLSIEEIIAKLAAQTDPETGKWVYGRNTIMQKLPGVSEWKIRRVIEAVRGTGKVATSAPTPRQLANMKQETEILALPKIVVNVPKRPAPKSPVKAEETWVIGSDFHAPMQHDSSCEIFYKVIEYLQPTKVILLGDVVNLDLFSRYDKVPDSPSWVEDVSSAGIILGNVKQAAPKAKLEWWEGNHEQRLKKHLTRHDPVLYEKLSVPKLFTISDNSSAQKSLEGWEYIADTERYLPELDMVLKHGNVTRKNTGMSAAAEMDNLLMSVVMGHGHRLGLTRRSSGRSRYKNEQSLFGMETGCLCRYDLPYRDGQTSNWQHGFGILFVDRSGDSPLIEPSTVEINNKRASFQGKIFKA